MRLFPAIDIMGGKAVRLTQGNYDSETVYEDDPVSVAQRWEAAGASYIHVVDLDGALNGRWTNRKVIKSIVESVRIPVQTGGGVRTLEDIEERLNTGVHRVILGTVAVKQPEIVAHAVTKFGRDAIAVGIDAKEGMVAIHGWEEVSTMSALALCEQMKMLGVSTIIYTDIAKDGMMSGPNVEQTEKMAQATGLKVIASGGVARYEDIESLMTCGAEGVVIGKALYNGAIDLKEAIRRYEKG